MSSDIAALDALAAPPPDFFVAEVAAAVAAQFGLRGDYQALVSERDQNFHLAASDGRDYVVKVTSAVQEPLVTDFQVAALRHLEACRELRLPRVVTAMGGAATGAIECSGVTHCLRVVTYVDGVQLAEAPLDADLAYDFGAALARLDRGLAGFSHAGQSPLLLWDLQRVADLRSLLDGIDDAPARKSVARAIDDYVNRVVPRLPGLRCQVIHGDANPENVLLARGRRQVRGFIDFSDMIHAPLVFDVAIAAAYLRDENDPAGPIGAFVAGFQSRLTLQAAELELLFDLVRARLATTITLLYWRLRARVQDDPYRQKALALEKGAFRFLDAVDIFGRDAFLKKIK